jgi:hypothetical protein
VGSAVGVSVGGAGVGEGVTVAVGEASRVGVGCRVVGGPGVQDGVSVLSAESQAVRAATASTPIDAHTRSNRAGDTTRPTLM